MAAGFDDKQRRFTALHQSGCFVMPNPWDVGTARMLASLGFPALATSSAGFAFSRGLPDADGSVDRDSMLAHIKDIVAATDLPVNADFEGGFAVEPDDVAANVRLCVATGVCGLSIEDSTARPDQPLYPFELAVERIRAARRAIDATGAGTLLVARAEAYLVGHADPLPEVLKRLTAFAEAGADVLYAPGPRTPEAIAAIVRAVAPKPVNLLIGADIGLSVADAAALGVRRISVGGALARAAWGGFLTAAREIARDGTFHGFSQGEPFADLNRFFKTWSPSSPAG